MDEKRIRKEKVADSKISGHVSTGSKSQRSIGDFKKNTSTFAMRRSRNEKQIFVPISTHCN